MTDEQRRKNLDVPAGMIDVVLDTDAYNENDDQVAIAYMLRSKEKLNVKAIYAAPFSNSRAATPDEGMEKSYDEILKLLGIMGERVDVLRGSTSYLPNEQTPVVSDAARDLAARARAYSPEHPLYVVAIGAITNVASAILLEPLVAENTVVVWLGGHAHHFHDTKEFNMMQDYAAARVVMGSGVPFVQLPCNGVVSAFTISEPELRYWLVGKTPIADYLATEYIKATGSGGRPWTRVVWDVTAVAWLLNENGRFMLSRLQPIRLPEYTGQYAEEGKTAGCYVYHIHRNALMADLIQKLTQE